MWWDRHLYLGFCLVAGAGESLVEAHATEKNLGLPRCQEKQHNLLRQTSPTKPNLPSPPRKTSKVEYSLVVLKECYTFVKHHNVKSGWLSAFWPTIFRRSFLQKYCFVIFISQIVYTLVQLSWPIGLESDYWPKIFKLKRIKWKWEIFIRAFCFTFLWVRVWFRIRFGNSFYVRNWVWVRDCWVRINNKGDKDFWWNCFFNLFSCRNVWKQLCYIIYVPIIRCVKFVTTCGCRQQR